MSLHKNIIEDYNKARRTKESADTKAILSALVSDLSTMAKDAKVATLPDDIVIGYLSSTKKTLKAHVLDVVEEGSEYYIITKHKIDLISTYLPQQLTDEEIVHIIEKNSLTTLPNVMKHFNTHVTKGTFDNGNVRKLFMSLIAK